MILYHLLGVLVCVVVVSGRTLLVETETGKAGIKTGKTGKTGIKTGKIGEEAGDDYR